MTQSLARIGSAAALFAIACATAAPAPTSTPAAPPPQDVEALQVPSGLSPVATLAAKGVQIYACTAGTPAPAWKLKAPQAELTDPAGAPAGKHYAGPSWELVNGAVVTGAVLQREPARGGNIPWLFGGLTEAKGQSPWGPLGHIVRRDTQGGVAPAEGCDPGHLGQEVQVRYTANYVFYAKAAGR